VSVNTIDVPRPPGAVWAVLAEPGTYAEWVTGAADIRDVEGEWPQPGSTFKHTQGIPVIGLRDSSSVVAVDPQRRLALEVRARPFVVAEVIIELESQDGGTHVTMTERPIGGLLEKIYRPRIDRVIHHRNEESLRRLKNLAERQKLLQDMLHKIASGEIQ